MRDLIADHLTHMKAEGRAANTIQDRGELLRRVDRDLPMGLEQATPREITSWLANDDWSAQTKATYIGHIKGFFEWATGGDRPILDYNPVARLKRPKVPRRQPRPFTDEQFEIIFTKAAEPYRTWLLLGAYAGLRAVEVSRLNREDITPRQLAVVGKGNKLAVIRTHPLIWAAVKDLPPGPIARTQDGRRATPNYVSYTVGRHLRSIGVQGSLHRARHWLGTTSLRQTNNLRTVQELLRHSSPATTAIYTAITDDQLWDAISGLPEPPDPLVA
jgi:integrase/recombinase XerC